MLFCVQERFPSSPGQTPAGASPSSAGTQGPFLPPSRFLVPTGGESTQPLSQGRMPGAGTLLLRELLGGLKLASAGKHREWEERERGRQREHLPCVPFGNPARGLRPARRGNLIREMKGVHDGAFMAHSMRNRVLMVMWSRKTKGALVSRGKSTGRLTSQRRSQQHRLMLVKQCSEYCRSHTARASGNLRSVFSSTAFGAMPRVL